MYDASTGVGIGEADTLKITAPVYVMVDSKIEYESIAATVSNVIGIIAVRLNRSTKSFVPN